MTSTTSFELPAVAERYFAAWAAGDAAAIVRLHSADTMFWTRLGASAPVVGRDAVRQAFEGIFARFPGFSFETYRVRYGENHWVLDWALLSGGARFDCLDVVEVGPDGLVTRKDTFIDAVQMQAALTAGER